MQVRYEKNGVAVSDLHDFDLDEILNCGQCFRWEKEEDGAYTGVAFDTPLRLYQQGSSLFFEGTTREQFEKTWSPYFDLGTDYGEIKETLSSDPVIQSAAGFAPGIRILRQEPFEALCSFIISQNNNIKRIRGIIKNFCQCFGRPLGDGFFAFPTPERLAACTLSDLAPIRCGFRAKYLIDAGQKVAAGDIPLEALYTLPYPAAREMLMQIKGVGPKVADCVLLYGFYRLEAFPLDVWMKRAVEKFYPQGLPSCFAGYEGIAQQYIFHFIRTNWQDMV